MAANSASSMKEGWATNPTERPFPEARKRATYLAPFDLYLLASFQL